MIRTLVASDVDEALSIAQIKKKKHRNATFSRDDIEQLLLSDRTECLGYFEDNKLITWIAYRFGELHGENIWCIVNMFTSKFASRFSFDGPDFGPIIKTIFEKAEARNVYTYIYVIPQKVEKVYYEKWKTNPHLPPKNRYETFDLAIIKANTIPSEKWMERLIGGTLPYDCVIKKRSLKMEFRNEHRGS